MTEEVEAVVVDPAATRDAAPEAADPAEPAVEDPAETEGAPDLEPMIEEPVVVEEAAEVAGPCLTPAIKATAVHEPEAQMPASVSDRPTREPKASQEGRVDIWLAETRYLLSTLDREFEGDVGEIFAFLRTKLNLQPAA